MGAGSDTWSVLLVWHCVASVVYMYTFNNYAISDATQYICIHNTIKLYVSMYSKDNSSSLLCIA